MNDVSLLLLAGVLGAFWSTFGLSPDQILPIAAAMRILDGQTPFVDFQVPYGIVSGALFVPFVAFAPTYGWALLAASAMLNASAAWLVLSLGRFAGVSTQGRVAGALLTALWFLPPFGTYYHDHLAYALALGGALAFTRPTTTRSALAAVLMVLAYHSKQSVGLACLLALGLSALLAQGRSVITARSTWWLVAVYVVAHLAFLVCLALFASLDGYARYAVLLPMDFAARDGRDLAQLGYALIFPFGIDPLQMIAERGWGRMAFFPIVCLTYVAYGWIIQSGWRARDDTANRRLFVVAYLTGSTVLAAGLLGRSMFEVTFGLMGAFALLSADWRPAMKHAIVAGAAMQAVCVLAWVHRPWTPGDRFFARTPIAPIAVRPGFFDLEATKGAVERLRARPGPTAFLGEPAALVPIALGRTPVQPPLYYHHALTVPARPDRRETWQDEFVAALERDQAVSVVTALEMSGAFRDPRHDGDDLPRLAAFLRERFDATFERDGLEVLERRGR